MFYSKRDGNKEIYLMNADGGDPQRVTNNAADDYYPDLSPNGKQVVFTSMRTGNAEIFVADLDGICLRTRSKISITSVTRLTGRKLDK